MTRDGLRAGALAAGLWLIGAGHGAADGVAPWQSPIGPDGVTRIVVEAEGMEGVNPKAFGGASPEWRVGRAGVDHYQCCTFGGHWQSRTRTAMTDAGENSAAISAEVDIPKAGTYKLWVKYECPPFFNYAFDVMVTPAGAGQPVFAKTYGLIDSPKHFSFNEKLVTGSLYWSWGIDHDAAEGYTLQMPAGKCRVTIAKTRNPAPAGMRSIDVVMITDDLADLSSPRMSRYPLLDELRRANHVFLRFRVPKKAPGLLQITWNRWGKRYNDFYQAFYMDMVRTYDAGGALVTNAAGQPYVGAYWLAGQIAEPLKPGETGRWLDIGPTLNVESAATFWSKAVVVDEKGRAVTNSTAPVTYAVDFALAPDDKRVVKTLELTRGEPGGVLTALVQPDLDTEDGQRWTMKLADVYRSVAAELDKEKRRGSIPRRMRFFSGTGAPTFPEQTEWSWELAMDFRRALGLNTVYGSALSLGAADYAKQEEWSREHGFELARSACFHHSQDVEDVAKKVKDLGTVDRFHYLSYGDEIGLPALDATKPEVVAAFQEYLRKQGVTPQLLGVDGWDRLKPLTALSSDVAVQIGVIPQAAAGGSVDRTLKRLYWYSCQFRIEQGCLDFARKTARFRELMGPDAHTSANLGGMHPFYWMHQSSFIESFKRNAMTLAWTEDYDFTQPELSRLAVEFLGGYLKAGTKYNKQRMMFYCMPHYPGQSPEHLLQNAVLEMGQNVKDIDWFCTAPDGFTTENYVNPRGGLPTFRALRQVSDMAGVVEDWLEPAGPVDAAVAMLLSEASDLWEVGGMGQGAVQPGSEPTNAFQEERKNTYYILRNAGYRVDLITEADVREGYLKRYRALYVGGENMERATALALAEWVKGGGVLYVSAGGARKDEFDEPLTELDGVLGRGERVSWQRYKGPLRSKLELLFLNALETVKLEDGSTFVGLACVEKFAGEKEAPVLGIFADGSPAFVMKEHGTGRGYYAGVMPGQAWAKAALPIMPCGRGGPENSTRYPQFEPVAFDGPAASVVVQPLRDAGIQPDVRADKPHIVCNRLAGPKGTVLTVVNLGHNQLGPVKNVTIAVDGVSQPSKVWSYQYPKGLKGEFKDGVQSLRLPEVRLADMVVIER